jgi:hypothetical protein
VIFTSLTLSLVASAYLVVAIVVVARNKSGYKHVKHTISELGESGSKQMRRVSLGVFFPVGAILAIVAWLQHTPNTPVAALSISIAAGYITSALFPCDPGSPTIGSFRQTMHNVGGGVQYVGGALALLWIAETAGPVFRTAGLLIAASAVLLLFESQFRGLIQRIAEACLFAGLLAALRMT